MFAAGMSPIAIAKALNAERIPGPRGDAWRDTTIRGHAGRGTGILRNELYIGRLVWNRMGFVRNPETGRRVSRSKSELQLIARDVPEFRIVDQDLWDQVQARLTEVRVASGADNPDRPRYWEHRRAQHMLTGKLFCGCCDGPMNNIANGVGPATTARRLCLRGHPRRAASSRAPGAGAEALLWPRPSAGRGFCWRFMDNFACWSVMCVPGTGGSLPGS